MKTNRINHANPSWIGMLFILFTVTILPNIGIAQNKKENKDIIPLQIGDYIPEELWKASLPVVNHPTGKDEITLEEFKGKLIILDFWGTYCTSCIAGFPKIKLIQKDNPDKVKLLAISPEPKTVLTKWFKSEIGKDYDYINSTYGDTLLKKYFPHRSVPHVIWISPEGKYISATNTYEITQKNIEEALKSQKAKFRVKVDMDKRKPLLLTENFHLIKDLKLTFYSIFVQGYYPGFPAGTNFKRTAQGKVYGRQYTSKTLYGILSSLAFQIFEERGDKFNKKRLIINTNNPLLDYRSGSYGNDTLRYDQYFNYELIVPENKADSLYTYMLQDLNRYLDIKLSIENRQTDCLVLVRTSKSDKIRTNGEKQKTNYDEASSEYSMQNSPVSFLLNRLNEISISQLPLIDETDYNGNIDLNLKSTKSLDDVRKHLQKYDLDIKKAKRDLLMFIISDK